MRDICERCGHHAKDHDEGGCLICDCSFPQHLVWT